jgi:protein CpxP
MTKIRSRKLAVAAALLALCTGPAFAQSPDNPGPPSGEPRGHHERAGGPERELTALTRVLTLTPEQQTGVKAILEQQTTQMKALHAKNESEAANDTADTRQARMTQMAQIREESDTKIAALLDDNQKKLFADWTARRKAAMERRQQQGGAPPAGSTPPASPN